MANLRNEDAIKECDIIPFNHTDHSAIILKVEGDQGRTKSRGIWRLNTSFPTDEAYIKTIKDNFEKWKE